MNKPLTKWEILTTLLLLVPAVLFSYDLAGADKLFLLLMLAAGIAIVRFLVLLLSWWLPLSG